ncbi:MAG: HAD-IIB family hydrolase [Burkholderiales bacterium]
MKPLTELRGASRLRGLLFDLDDTLTTHGRLTGQAYAALERLHAAGRLAVAVTGRPAGWCDHIARMWPVDAVVGENGAFYFRFRDGRLDKRYHEGEGVRRAKRARLEAIIARIVAAVPGTAVSADQAYRETDLAIDYCEDVPPLPLEAAERVAVLMREAGLTAKISSIHVNGWFGDYDKLAMTRTLFSEAFGLDLEAVRDEIAFAGDSPNDAPMFGFFPNSVGMANIARFAGRISPEPAYVARAEAGTGFAELVGHMLGEC